jgi:adenine-specific DNA-methyltransferase
MPTLSWLTRDEDLKTAGRAPYRLLQEVPELGHGDPDTGNMLIQGDNLEALKSLLPFYAGQVKCIYIDPPYNTRSAFEHYDDNLEHSRWLAMMWPRLELLRELLAEDGSIWVSIDDNEGHYLKVIMDEVFGRTCYIGTIVWRSSDNSNNDAKKVSQDHNDVHVFARHSEYVTKRVKPRDDQQSHYSNPDNDPRGPWFDGNPLGSPSPRPNLTYDIVAPNGNVIKPPRNGWRWSKETLAEKMASGEIRFNDAQTGIKRRTYQADQKGIPPSSLWIELDETGHNRQAKSEQRNLFADRSPEELFGTPKPERLLSKIIEIASNPGDLVLDSFLGSGTTAAVAQKMGRRYIGIEVGDHAVTYCQPRLTKVVDGEQGGVSKAQNWTGGGGFRFWRLGPPVFDETGRISDEIAFSTLAAHVWFSETSAPLDPKTKGPLLGVHGDRAVALLYNGVLGDKRPAGGNVLTRQTLAIIREGLLSDFDGDLIVYGERSALTPATLARERIEFRQTPYDVKARR